MAFDSLSEKLQNVFKNLRSKGKLTAVSYTHLDVYKRQIYECPLCGGAGILEEDCGSSYYVTCLECGCHSVNIDFKSDDDLSLIHI